jgi:hypothetical protein
MWKQSALLDRLSQVEWEKMTAVSAPATDIPAYIVGLTSSDADLRAASVERLSWSVIHQGDVSELAACVVPFLIDLLPASPADLKVEMLALLANLAGAINNEEQRQREPLPPEWAAQMAPYVRPAELSIQIERETYQAVRAGLSTYLALAADPDPRIREAAQWVLRHYPEVSDASARGG